MNQTFAVLTATAALMVAGPALAQDKTANTFGGASFESVPNSYETGYGYGATPAPRRIVAPRAPRAVILPFRESGASKRG